MVTELLERVGVGGQERTEEPKGEGAKITPHPPGALESAKAVYRKWLELPDDRVLDFVFGVICANVFGGDPVWGGIVGGSGDTKTEILRSLQHPIIFPLSDLSANSLISGLRSEDAYGGDEPSLLPKLDGRILVVKDLTPLISGNAESRNKVLGDLRDVYDGSATKAFGTGQVKSFESRFGMLFGVTPVIESCWPDINALGDRFIYYRCEPGNSLAKVKAAFNNSDRKKEMREELAGAAGSVLAIEVVRDINVMEKFRTELIHLADFVAKARSPVKRKGQTEEIEYEPIPEIGTRLVGQFAQLARGIAVARQVRTVNDSIMELVRHVARSAIPRDRLRLLECLSQFDAAKSTQEIGTNMRMGCGSLNRKLEDLWALSLVERKTSVSGRFAWRLSDLARERIRQSKLLDKR